MVIGILGLIIFWQVSEIKVLRYGAEAVALENGVRPDPVRYFILYAPGEPRF